ncbi:MAG: polysaccharide export protein [Acidobacteriota bacterium]|nr:polysaccharide export protein [Acidobacteriota bacterium]
MISVLRVAAAAMALMSFAGAGETALHQRADRYRLQPSDVLEVRFRFSPEFNETVTVQPDGFITLQVAGDLKIAGLTVPEATLEIVQKSAKVLHDPEVTIALKEFVKPAFYVGGNVVKPGKFELHGEMTLTDAITSAGGFAPGAKDTDVLLFRRISREMVEVKRIDVKRAIDKDALREDIDLQPNDSIYVSKSWVGKIDRFMQVTRLGMYFNPLPFKF